MIVNGERRIAPLSIPPFDTPLDTPVPQEDDRSLLGAAFRQDNLAVNAWQWATGPANHDRASEPTVDPWAQIKGTTYEQHAENFGGLHTQSEIDDEMRRIDQETADKQYLAESGLAGVGASLLAGILDPSILIPGAGAIKGAGFAVNAARVGATAGAATVATETALHALQSTRTGAESAVNVGGTVLLGGLLGGVAGKLIGKGAPEASEAFARAGAGIEEIAGMPPEARVARTADAMGAAATRAAQITDFDLPTRAAQFVQDNTPKWATMSQRLQTAQSPAARNVAAQLLTTDHLAFKGTDDLGLMASVERRATMDVDRYQITARKHYNAALRESGMTRQEFDKALSGAMRRGDAHTNAVVAKTAQAMRKEIFEPLKNMGIKAGLLPPDVDVTTAASYFSRRWRKEAIVQDSPTFLRRLEADFRRQGYDDAAPDVAREVYDTLTGNSISSDPFRIVVQARGPFKERTLNVEDINYEEFLDNDFLNVTDGHARTMVVDSLLQEQFGGRDLAEQLRAIRSDYADIRAKLDATDTKGRVKLQAEEEQVLRQVNAARDMLRGNHNAEYNGSSMAKVQQTLMTWNYVRALGGMTMSAIPDLARGIMTAGMMPAFREGFVPLLRALTKTSNATSKASRVALREAAGISESLLSSRMFAIAEIGDPLSSRGPISGLFANVLAPAASKWSGMNLWNDVLKESVVALAANRTARMAEAAALSADETVFLQLGNMNSTTWRQVADELKTHGKWVTPDTFDPGVAAWTNPTLRTEYLALLRSEADRAIVTPSIGDRNYYVKQYPLLAFAAQFKSFMLAAHSRVLIAGLSGDRAKFATFAVASTTLGMLTFALKQAAAGREQSDNPGTWLAEGIDRSGMIPMVMEVNNTVEKFGLPGIYLALGSMGGDTSARASRYASRYATDALLGPTAGLVQSVVESTAAPLAAITQGEAVDPKAANAARNLLPFGRHPGVQQLLDWYILPSARVALGGEPQ